MNNLTVLISKNGGTWFVTIIHVALATLWPCRLCKDDDDDDDDNDDDDDDFLHTALYCHHHHILFIIYTVFHNYGTP